MILLYSKHIQGMQNFMKALGAAVPSLRKLFGASAGAAGLPEAIAIASLVLRDCCPLLASLHGPHMMQFEELQQVKLYIAYIRISDLCLPIL